LGQSPPFPPISAEGRTSSAVVAGGASTTASGLTVLLIIAGVGAVCIVFGGPAALRRAHGRKTRDLAHSELRIIRPVHRPKTAPDPPPASFAGQVASLRRSVSNLGMRIVRLPSVTSTTSSLGRAASRVRPLGCGGDHETTSLVEIALDSGSSSPRPPQDEPSPQLQHHAHFEETSQEPPQRRGAPYLTKHGSNASHWTSAGSMTANSMRI